MTLQSQLLSYGRYFGASFILTFLAYGSGSGVMEWFNQQDAPLQAIADNPLLLGYGIFAMAALHLLFNMLVLVNGRKILNAFGQQVPCYFILGSLATLLLTLGALGFLWLFDPSISVAQYQQIVQVNFYCYQIGMILWSLAGMQFCISLMRTKVVNTFFAAFGVLAYLVFGLGCVAELFGLPIGVICAMGGMVFELGLSIYWLSRKSSHWQAMPIQGGGFQPA